MVKAFWQMQRKKIPGRRNAGTGRAAARPD
jgi:hypothetical protein